MRIYNIKENRKEEILEYIRALIETRYGYPALASISIDDQSVCGSDIYGFQFNGGNTGSKCINCVIFKNPKSEDDPLIIGHGMRGYDYYGTSSNVTIKLSNFLAENPKYANMEEWLDPAVSERERCKNTNTDSRTKTCGFRRPDGLEYILDIPDEALDNGRVVGNSSPSAPINVWMKNMEDSLTTRYYRDLALDDIYNIKRDQVTWINGIWFGYDYMPLGSVMVGLSPRTPANTVNR